MNNRFVNMIKQLLDKMKAEPDDFSGADHLTNKVLLNELTSHFKTMLENESVGQRMLYPMSFNILMASADYEERRQSLPFVLPEVVANFYRIIESMKTQYPNYTPPAKYWFFQSHCRPGSPSPHACNDCRPPRKSPFWRNPGRSHTRPAGL